MSYTFTPPRLRILNAVIDAVKGVTPLNGYESDLSDDAHGQPRVVSGRLTIGNSEPLPMISIVEPAMGAEGIAPKQRDNTGRLADWDLLVQGWIKAEAAHPTRPGYQMVAEIQHRLANQITKHNGRPGGALGQNILGLGTLVERLEVGAAVVRPNEYISEQTVFYFVLSLQFAEDVAAPLR